MTAMRSIYAGKPSPSWTARISSPGSRDSSWRNAGCSPAPWNCLADAARTRTALRDTATRPLAVLAHVAHSRWRTLPVPVPTCASLGRPAIMDIAGATSRMGVATQISAHATPPRITATGLDSASPAGRRRPLVARPLGRMTSAGKTSSAQAHRRDRGSAVRACLWTPPARHFVTNVRGSRYA
jgi:hypothetical protein